MGFFLRLFFYGKTIMFLSFSLCPQASIFDRTDALTNKDKRKKKSKNKNSAKKDQGERAYCMGGETNLNLHGGRSKGAH